ncbi:hypothetical protein [uncultured Lacinutrix sp.]|uniref:hypothetical protein n=1 Tax=uncultured Lacinutrix sp. TaxID=574032 RepID=UPI00261A7BC1|nr:hypothetical protein [uncultured Lacinutrix sp.]
MKNLFKLFLALVLLISCANNENKKMSIPNGIEASAKKNQVTKNTAHFLSDLNEGFYKNPILKIENNKEYNYDKNSIEDNSIKESSNIFYLSENAITSDLSSSIMYNFKTPGNRISGKSFRCHGNFVIRHDGSLRATITTSSNRYQGFTGAVQLNFYDRNQNHVFSIYSPSYGVNGLEYRNDVWEYQFSEWETELLKASSYADGYGIHTPKGLDWGEIYYFSKKVFEDFKSGSGS